MTMLSRREWHKLMAAGLVAGVGQALPRAQVQESRIAGVLVGAQSYSFRDRDLQGVIDGMVEVGISSCELFEPHLFPGGLRMDREVVREWRYTTGPEYFTDVRDRFADAGLTIDSYNVSFKDDFTDAEIYAGFEAAKVLGAPAITSSAHVNSVPRIARMAAEHGIPAAMHNHSGVHFNEFSSPEQFAAAMAQGDGQSITVNLDIGHFVAANHDPVAYLREHHAQITALHIKDRRRNEGPNTVWGEGDTPIGEVLRLVRDEGWDIPCNIEYEYRGGDTIEEMKRCFEFARRELEA